jgi:heat shock protein HslJ
MMRFGAVLVALLVLAGCARGGPSAPAGGPWGRTFLSASASRQLVAGTRIELRFGDGKLSVQAGCNHMSGDARIDRDRLRVDEMEMTEMGCDPPRHDQDSWVSTFLQAGPTVQLSGPDLVLDGGGIRIAFVDREVADPDRPLAGPVWTVDTLVTGQSAGSVPVGVRAFLTLAADGTVSGSTGCNQLSGRYSVQGDAVTFTDVGSTLMACAGDPGMVEGRVLAVLRGTVHFKIQASRLTLTAADGNGLGLNAAAQPSPS